MINADSRTNNNDYSTSVHSEQCTDFIHMRTSIAFQKTKKNKEVCFIIIFSFCGCKCTVRDKKITQLIPGGTEICNVIGYQLIQQTTFRNSPVSLQRPMGMNEGAMVPCAKAWFREVGPRTGLMQLGHIN